MTNKINIALLIAVKNKVKKSNQNERQSIVRNEVAPSYHQLGYSF